MEDMTCKNSSESLESRLQCAADQLTDRIASIIGSFDKKFDDVLKPQAPFTAASYVQVSKALFSNLLGGIGYFYGDWRAAQNIRPGVRGRQRGVLGRCD